MHINHLSYTVFTIHLLNKPQQNQGHWIKKKLMERIDAKRTKTSLPVQPPMCFPPGHGKDKKFFSHHFLE